MRTSCWSWLYLLINTLTIHTVNSIRCYSCFWRQEDSHTMSDCIEGNTVKYSRSMNAAVYVSDSSCLRCLKTQVWSNGRLVSVYRSCVQSLQKPAHAELECDVRQVDSTTKQTLVECMCARDLCNNSQSWHRHYSVKNLFFYGILGCLTRLFTLKYV